MKIYEYCRKWRKEHGYKVEDIAERCRYSTWNVYSFEQGRADTNAILLGYVRLGMELNQIILRGIEI